MPSRIHIANVPPEVTVEELRALFQRLGVTGEVHLARDETSSRFAGEAYVDCESPEQAAAAASKLRGHVFGEVRLECETVETAEFFDRDGLFADGEAPMGRQDGSFRDEEE